MIRELVRGILAGRPPARPPPLPDGTAGTTPGIGGAPAKPTVFMLLAAVALILLTRSIPFLDVHDPWIDEAMLLANFPLDRLSGFFRPLPLFEQAAPLGHIALLHTFASLFPEDAVTPLRLSSAVASLLAAGLILASLRRISSGPVVPLALALTCLPPFIVYYSLEIKQYVFEYLATTIIMYASLRLLHDYSGKNTLIFLGACVFAIAFSFTAPIAIGAFGMAIVAHRWISNSQRKGPSRKFGIVAALALSATIFLAYYLAYTRPVTEIFFSAWAFKYDANLLTFPPLTEAALLQWFELPKFLQWQLDLAPVFIYSDFPSAKLNWIVPVVFWVLFAAGMASAAVRFVFLPASIIFAVFMIYGLSLAGLMPIAFVRNFAFLMPITGIILAFGISACLQWFFRWAMPKRAPQFVSACLAFGVLAAGASGLYRSGKLEREELSPLIEHIVARDTVDTPVWVYYGAQPAMRILAPDSMAQIGLVSHESGNPSWVSKVRGFPDYTTSDAYFEDFRESIKGLSKLWLVFSHTWVERPGLGRFMDIAEQEIGGCREVMTATGTRLWRCGKPVRER